MSDHHILSWLTEKISDKLNKPPNVGIVKGLIKLYINNNSYDSFLRFTGAIGFPKDNNFEFSAEIYHVISENIHILENTVGAAAPVDEEAKQSAKKDPTRPKINVHIDMEDNIKDNFDETNSESLKKNNSSLNRTSVQAESESSDILNSLVGSDTVKNSSSFGTKIKARKFKKISKEAAFRFKSTTERPLKPVLENKERNEIKDGPHANTHNVQNRLDILAAQERINESVNEEKENLYEENRDKMSAGDYGVDLKGDREWYMNDEMGLEQDDFYANFDDNSIKFPATKTKKARRANRKEVGGSYDESTGAYIDFDHDEEGLSISEQIQIKSHFYIPPFLREFDTFANFDERKILPGGGVGSVMNPVKCPDKSLAVMARTGNNSLKSKQIQKEKKLQAKERADLTGTILGNVLGTEQDNLNDHPEENNQKEIDINTPTSDNINAIRKQRMSLPAYSCKAELMQVIAENQVVIVIGETGSGKTTQLTQFLFEEGFAGNLENNQKRRIIGCTQPRRVAAMSVAKRVSEEMNCKLGEEVGYSIRFEDVTTKEKTVIKYLTDGILLRELLYDPNLENYSCIIIDEAHERSLNTDVLLGLLKNLISRRKDIKLIVTSATMNAGRFIEYFGNAPQFTIPGRTFPVEIMYSKSPCSDYIDAAVKQVLTIHLQNISKNGRSDGDILVFMTGQDDIEMTCTLIKEKLDLLENPPPLDVFPIYSTLPADLQKKIFNKSNTLRRKVVVATNIAETSLTVDGVRYVVDSGLAKLKVYNPKLGMDTLKVVPISYANANQRSGRAGRTAPGVAYRLYTEEAAKEEMYPQPIPEIQRTNLDNIMLMLKSRNIVDIMKFPFLDTPPRDLLGFSLYELWAIGALDNFGILTPLGREMCKFPTEPSLSKLIVLSCTDEFHCSKEVVIIVAMLTVPSVFYRPKERMEEADIARDKFIVSESDHLTLLNVYNQWEAQISKHNTNARRINAWCARNFLHSKSLARAREIKQQLEIILKTSKMKLSASKFDDSIRKCLAAAFFHKSAQLNKSNTGNANTSEYMNLRNNFVRMYLHPTSGLVDSGEIMNSYVVYNELILTNKEYMSCVTTVDPIWLLEYGGVFYETSIESVRMINEKYGKNLKPASAFSEILESDSQKYELQKSKNTSMKKSSLTKTLNKNTKFRRRAF